MEFLHLLLDCLSLELLYDFMTFSEVNYIKRVRAEIATLISGPDIGGHPILVFGAITGYIL